MNIIEASKILTDLRIAYPNSYNNMTPLDAEAAVRMWARIFSDKSYQSVSMAVEAIIRTSTSGFPPAMGEVMDRIIKTEQGPEMTEMEAWEHLYKAIKNSAWHAQEEYRKLPAVVQQCAGSPEMLQSWASMPEDTVQSVIQSNFMRTFKTKKTMNREQLALPESMRDQVLQLANKSALITK